MRFRPATLADATQVRGDDGAPLARMGRMAWAAMTGAICDHGAVAAEDANGALLCIGGAVPDERRGWREAWVAATPLAQVAPVSFVRTCAFVWRALEAADRSMLVAWVRAGVASAVRLSRLLGLSPLTREPGWILFGRPA